MNTALWVIASVLALVFLAAGLIKISQSREKLSASGMAWTADFSPGTVKTVGAVEVLGALGLVLPAAARNRSETRPPPRRPSRPGRPT
ncbi:DoxX family protein [Streptomyces sp. NPDC058579]|uniref:DoxX family protein n=1 Tax=Streptomyces sp. NPDC058579 TaxID=3346548 RepID=UPI003654F697